MPARGSYLLVLLLVLGMGGCARSTLPRAEVEQKFMAQIRENDPAVDRALTQAKYHRLAGRLDLAKEALITALPHQANNTRLLNALGNLEDDFGNYAQAQERYRQILTLEPDNVLARNNLGYSYYLAGDFQQAEAILREVATNHPENIVARNNLGLVLCRQGRQAEALALWEKYDGPGAAQEKLQTVLTLLGNSRSDNLADSAPLTRREPTQPESGEAVRSATPPRQVSLAPTPSEVKLGRVSPSMFAISSAPGAAPAPSVKVEEVPMIVQPAAAPLESRGSGLPAPKVTPPPRAESRPGDLSPPEIAAADLEDEEAPPARPALPRSKRQIKFRMLTVPPEEASSRSAVRHYLQQLQIHQQTGGAAQKDNLVF
jgi:tetratricopeptide (TPR) repeat protein